MHSNDFLPRLTEWKIVVKKVRWTAEQSVDAPESALSARAESARALQINHAFANVRRRCATWEGCYVLEAVATGRDRTRWARHFPSAVNQTGLCEGERGAGGVAGEDDEEKERRAHTWREGRNVIDRARCTVIETHSRGPLTTTDRTHSETWGTLMIIARTRRDRTADLSSSSSLGGTRLPADNGPILAWPCILTSAR